MNALAVTSPSLVSHSQTERVAREWVVKFAELYAVSLADRGPRFVELWASAVADLSPDMLDAACRKAMQTCKFFPMPAEVRLATFSLCGFRGRRFPEQSLTSDFFSRVFAQIVTWAFHGRSMAGKPATSQ